MSRSRDTSQRRRRYRRKTRVALAGAGVLSIGAGVVIVAQIGAFFLHSSTAGRALVAKERTAIARAAQRPSACLAPDDAAAGGGTTASGSTTAGESNGEADGLLEAPTLGMTAPVLQGTGDSVLGEAVGHDPASVWPGQPGTSVLSAHDVTWFSRIGRLRPGDVVRYVTPCWTYTYQVTSHAVVSAGSPVYTTATARLVLDTCYPLDALYITSTRYLVYANLVSSSLTYTTATAATPATPATPAVPAPAALTAEGLALTQNPAPLGTLRLAGSPSRAWAQSSAPLDFEAAALTEFFGAVRSAEEEERTWWTDLAPSVAVASAGPLWDGQLAAYGTPLEITLRAVGARPAAVALAATVTVAGPDGAGRYDLAVTETVSRGKLLITGMRLTPAGS